MGDVMNSSRFGTQTGYTVSDCKETVTKGSPNPTWDHIIGFLDTALGVTAAPAHGQS
jgi:hypothetical protein